jgi:hypothetical protein
MKAAEEKVMEKQCPICKRYENTGTIIQIYKLPDGRYAEMCNTCAWTKYLNMQNNTHIVNSASFI